jgi:hypothetical protein
MISKIGITRQVLDPIFQRPGVNVPQLHENTKTDCKEMAK